MKKKTPTLAVIIPTFNEMRTIGSILEVVRTWGKAAEIIVVDDGSTDKTRDAVKEFGNSVRLVAHGKNKGKSKAMHTGIRTAKADLVMFLDADLLGLTHKSLDALVAKAHTGADMVVGVRGTGHALSRQFRSFGGERVLRRDDLVTLMPQIEHAGYGVEVLLNTAYKKKRIAYVLLPFVSHQIKLEKQPLGEAIGSYMKEAVEVAPRHAWYLMTLVLARMKGLLG